jgi:hypothetical protein
MNPDISSAIWEPTFTPAEKRVLSALRQRYRQDRDLFTQRELARLLFLRWLHRQGRLCP